MAVCTSCRRARWRREGAAANEGLDISEEALMYHIQLREDENVVRFLLDEGPLLLCFETCAGLDAAEGRSLMIGVGRVCWASACKCECLVSCILYYLVICIYLHTCTSLMTALLNKAFRPIGCYKIAAPK